MKISFISGRTVKACVPALAVVCVLCVADTASAANNDADGMTAVNSVMDRFLNFLQGPIVRFAAILAIVILGLGLAFAENGTGTRKILGVVFGLSLALFAVTFVNGLFGFSEADGFAVATSAEAIVEAQALHAGTEAEAAEAVATAAAGS